jgi:hypothetical protein
MVEIVNIDYERLILDIEDFISKGSDMPLATIRSAIWKVADLETPSYDELEEIFNIIKDIKPELYNKMVEIMLNKMNVTTDIIV